MPGYENAYVRNFNARDAEQTADVFFEAVRFGAKNFYDEEQRKAWAPQKPELNKWRTRLAEQAVKVAILDEAVIGFMTLDPNGKIDLAFVTPDAMGKGISAKLYDAILKEAQTAGLKTLHTEASYLAKQFFQKCGWQVIQQQTVSRESVELTNFLMKLDVPKPAENSKTHT